MSDRRYIPQRNDIIRASIHPFSVSSNSDRQFIYGIFGCNCRYQHFKLTTTGICSSLLKLNDRKIICGQGYFYLDDIESITIWSRHTFAARSIQKAWVRCRHNLAALLIQKSWVRCVSDPNYMVCQIRLESECLPTKPQDGIEITQQCLSIDNGQQCSSHM